MINGVPEVRPIDGFDGYFVSEIGEVYSIKPPRGLYNKGYIRGLMHEMALKEDKDGYLYLGLYASDSKRYFRRAHRLVADAFIVNPNNYPVVNHKDGNVQNNTMGNLEHCTVQDNTIHSFRVLGRDPSITTNKKVKLTNRQTNEILIFNSIKDCSIYLNMNYEHLGRILSGVRDINKWRMNHLYNVELIE